MFFDRKFKMMHPSSASNGRNERNERESIGMASEPPKTRFGKKTVGTISRKTPGEHFFDSDANSNEKKDLRLQNDETSFSLNFFVLAFALKKIKFCNLLLIDQMSGNSTNLRSKNRPNLNNLLAPLSPGFKPYLGQFFASCPDSRDVSSKTLD